MEQGTSICLLTMNKPDILRVTVQELLKTLEDPYEVIVFDNGSTDPNTLTILSEYENRRNWRVHRSNTNLGLSLGTNLSMEMGKYDCLIHMDDDCLIQRAGWNQVLRSYLTRFPEVGIVVPFQTGESIRREHYQELRWAMGMCWAIRKELFDDIGGYDPQLYHQNECDMALRVRMAGYHVAGVADFHAVHNDPGGQRSDIALAREHLGCVQFRDKWASYFRGRNWNYGTQPIYLMQHWPPDQEFLRRFSIQEGINLNPPPGEVTGNDIHSRWVSLDHLAGSQKIHIAGTDYLIYREIRNDYMHWDWKDNPDAYQYDRQLAINRWQELTGELYTGYKWPHNLLRPY